MKILLLHNYYQQPGGEDTVFNAECTSLKNAGHEVITYEKHNQNLKDLSKAKQLKVAQQTIWSHETYREISDLIRKQNPQIAHFINFFPQISPAAYYACQRAGVPTVQSLQNYRLLCLGATFTREQTVCVACLGKLPWRGVLHRCYRDSWTQSSTLMAMLTVHRGLRTWQNKIDAFIALHPFMKSQMEQGGLPSEKIFIKPNSLSYDPGMRQQAGDYALFVGRLAKEKGVHTLISAWKNRKESLLIIGDGPQKSELQKDANGANIQFLGWLSNQDVIAKMKQARFLIVPSEWFEGFPLTVIEAFACGVPIIVSNLGGLANFIDDGVTGLTFTAGDCVDLSAKIDWAVVHATEMEEMGRNGRKQYEQSYTVAANYKQLMQIYNAILT